MRRVLVLTTGLGPQDGWSRYSEGFVDGLRASGWEVDVAVEDELASRPDNWLKPVRLLRDAAWLSARARRADLIHAMVEPYAPLAMLLAAACRKPYLVSVHGTYGDRASYQAAARPLYASAFARASACLPVSRYTDAVLKRSFRPRRTEILPGGVRMPREAAPRDVPSGRPLVLSVGALKPRKGFHALIEAVAILRDGGLGLACELVGDAVDPAYEARLKEMIAERRLEPVVLLRGRLDDAALAERYARAAVFALAAEHDGPAFEGLGLVYLEAMARGTPCVGARESGAEDAIEEGVNGFLVPPGDAAALADAIRRVVSDAAAWKKLSEGARRAAERFRWERRVEKMLSVYRSLIP